MNPPRVANMHTFPWECYDPKDYLRIDRSSVWGNPYRIGTIFDETGTHYRSRIQSMRMYEELMLDRLIGRQGPAHGVGSRVNEDTGKRWSGVMIRGAPTILEQCAEGQLWIDRLKALENKILLCWCKPQLCHGDIIVDFYEELPKYIERLALHRLKSKEKE